MELEGSTHLLMWRSPLLKCLHKPQIRVAAPVCVCNYLLCAARPCVYRLSPAPLPEPIPTPHCTLTSWTFVCIVHISPHVREGGIRNKAAGQRRLENGVLMTPPTHTKACTAPPTLPDPSSPQYVAAKYWKYQYGTSEFRLINTASADSELSFCLCVLVYGNVYVCIGLNTLWGQMADLVIEFRRRSVLLPGNSHQQRRYERHRCPLARNPLFVALEGRWPRHLIAALQSTPVCQAIGCTMRRVATRLFFFL